MSFATLLHEGFEILVEKKAPPKPAPKPTKGKAKPPAKAPSESDEDPKMDAAMKHMTTLLKSQGRTARKGKKLQDLAAWILRQLGGRASASREESMALDESDQEVAKTILAQMGGTGKLKAMTGAKNFTSSENGVSFQWPAKGGGPNAVRITLTPEDTYTVEFIRAGKGGPKVVSKHEDIYAEDLKKLFEKQTGLYLSL